MKINRHFYLKLPNQKFVAGIVIDTFVLFFDYFTDDVNDFYNLDFNEAKRLFLVDNIEPLFKDEFVILTKLSKPYSKKIQKSLLFDEPSQSYFLHTIEADKTTKTKATMMDFLQFLDLAESTKMYAFDKELIRDEEQLNVHIQETLKKKILERLVRSSYNVEPQFPTSTFNAYEEYFHPISTELSADDENYDPKTIKKDVEEAIKSKLLPYLEKHGFKRYKKRKEFVKQLDNGVLQLLMFRSVWGNFTLDIHLYDMHFETYDSYYASGTLGEINKHGGDNFYHVELKTNNKAYLDYSVDRTIRILELYILPFLKKLETYEGIATTILEDEACSKYIKNLSHRFEVYKDFDTDAKAYIFEKANLLKGV